MNLAACVVSLAAVSSSLTACSSRDGTHVADVLETREQQVEQRIATATRSDELQLVARWILPRELREVSGVALLEDGRIVVHNDERGRIYVIDPKRGVILKHFSLGDRPLHGDFEAIAVRGQDIFLLQSNGEIYRFREGGSKARVPYARYDTKLGKECEFEGLEAEPASDALFLLCKTSSKKDERDKIVIYRWQPGNGRQPSLSLITVPVAFAAGSNDWKRLSPSDMTIDPATGHWVIIAAREKALVELTPEGHVVRSMKLPSSLQQPEGVAITRDGLIIISDEGVKNAADITVFRWIPSKAEQPPATALDSATSSAASGQ